MKIHLIFLFLFITNVAVLAQNQAPTVLSLEALEGKWYINQSNFPMWLKGKKANPTFNYTIKKKKGTLGLKDEVIFIKNGKQKSIVGFDTPIDKTNTKFVWTGKGILGILKSKWSVLYLDEEENWAIIYFEKTLFTPEGYDVISRDKKLSANLKESIQAVLTALNINEELTTIEQQ